jgi:SAM-dependent methyltransferase
LTRAGDDQPAWLYDLLGCPSCGQAPLKLLDGQLECSHCGAHHPVRDGVASLIRPELQGTYHAQQETWRRLEQARGRYNLSLEDVLRLPEETEVRAQLEWLRSLLRTRGRCRVLELGAGRGWASRILAGDGHHVVASDVLDDANIGLGCAVRQRGHTGLSFGCTLAAAESLPFHPGTFDCVFSFATLRHIMDLERVLQEVSRVLTPGGLFVAFQEPFRGIHTTQMQRLQGCSSYQLARWWQVGVLSSKTAAEVVHMRANLGSTYYEICRRVPFCLGCGKAAGLCTAVVPTSVLLDWPPDWNQPFSIKRQSLPEWLNPFAAAHGLDGEQLRAWIDRAERALGVDLLPELLAYWTAVGNTDGVLLARKGGDDLGPFPESRILGPERQRRLDRLLLGCAPQGFVPTYGFYPDNWMQPYSGFLIPGIDSVEITLVSPPPHFRNAPAKVELRLENERMPLLVFVIRHSKTVTLKVTIPKTAARRPSLLVRLTANLGFMPSDYSPGPGCDTRLLALRFHSVKAGQVSQDQVFADLKQLTEEKSSGS